MTALLTPGTLVRHALRPDWGLGQVQSVAQGKVTLNFENAGKVVIMAESADLLAVSEETRNDC